MDTIVCYALDKEAWRDVVLTEGKIGTKDIQTGNMT